MAVSDERGGVPASAARARLAPGPPLARLVQGLAARFDAEQDRWSLFAPVALGAGAGGYFALTAEPAWWLAALPFLLGAGAALAAGPARARAFALSLALAIAGFGLLVAKAHTSLVAAPKLESRLGPVVVTGRVESLTPREGGRVSALVRIERIGRLAAAETPRRVRLTMARGMAPERAGARIDVLAMLMPPPRPVAPGAYDFGRRAWFEGIGAYGYTLGRPRLAEGEGAGLAWTDRAAIWIDAVRARVAARVEAAIGGEGGAIAAALLTGLRGAIAESDLQAMRDAGLAHLLAISGLHMALMSGAAFWAVRFLIAAFPWLALRIVGKKWAAGAGLLTGLVYFGLAGGSVATERAFIMVAVALLAVMADRPAISLRNVALAALAILLLSPHAVLEAGFQMSFGAVVALTAFYEEAARWRLPGLAAGGAGPEAGGGPGSLAARTLAGVLLTTLVASLATGPLAAIHFNRVAAYGLVANLVAVPLTGFVVMPLGLVALIAMPFGLDAPALALMGKGTAYLVEVARTVAAWPGATSMVASPSAGVLPLFALGGLWLCLWRGRWRFWGLVPVAAAIAMIWAGRGPDILVDDEGRLIAVREATGLLVLSDGRSGAYEAAEWLRRDGDTRTVRAARAGPPRLLQGRDRDGRLACDRRACAAILAGGTRLAYIRHPAAMAEECGHADIVIAAIPLHRRCRGPAIVIDRFDVYRHGAHAIRLGGGVPVVTRVSDGVGDRPWARHPPGPRRRASQ